MNTIGAYQINSNQTFNARYLKIVDQENMPRQIVDAIYKSDAIDEFLKAGKKKSLFQRFLDIFRRDEILEISFYKDTVAQRKSLKNPNDKFESHATLSFNLGRENVHTCWDKRYYEINDAQFGIPNIKIGKGRILKKGEDPFLDEPIETVEDKIATRVMNLDDLDSKLKKLVDAD